MSSLTAVTGGFDVGAAHRIVAHMTLFSPAMPVGNTCTFKASFPAAAATSPKSMMATITRDLEGGGSQSNGIGVAACTPTELTIPLGVFSNRKVSYKVADNLAGLRTLTMKVQSLDGYGLNEVWHLELAILVDDTDTTDFKLRVVGSGMTIDSVDVTP